MSATGSERACRARGTAAARRRCPSTVAITMASTASSMVAGRVVRDQRSRRRGGNGSRCRSRRAAHLAEPDQVLLRQRQVEPHLVPLGLDLGDGRVRRQRHRRRIDRQQRAARRTAARRRRTGSGSEISKAACPRSVRTDVVASIPASMPANRIARLHGCVLATGRPQRHLASGRPQREVSSTPVHRTARSTQPLPYFA